MTVVDLFRYRAENGAEPFSDWLNRLRDKNAQARIRVRLRQLQAGNFGDCAGVGQGVVELRIHLGPGYRVYFGRQGASVVLLLSGGDKSSQAADIRRAQALWSEWQRRTS